MNGHTSNKLPEAGLEYKDYPSKKMAAYRGPSLLQPHKARQAIADAHAGRIPPLLGMFSAWASPPIAKVVAQLGFDFVWVEWEHASMSVETMTQIVHDIQFVSEGKSAALVRVPGHDHASIGFALDAGASIVVPQVDTAEQAKKIVAATKFGANAGGKRSAPPSRWVPQSSMQSCNPAISFWENQNLQAALIIQIESLEGINNLDAILTDIGEHVDSVWLGSLDLRVSMGLPGFWGQEPEWVSALNTFRLVLEKHNKPYSGLATGDDEWLKIRGEGRSVMFVASDLEAILRTRDDLARIRKLFPKNDYTTRSLGNGVED